MKRPRSPETPQGKSMMMGAGSDMALVHDLAGYVQYTSPAVSTIPASNGPGPRAATTLPLNLIALIVSYLDDVGDIARVTRAARLLYYMTLPQLYQRVDLHSYGQMRYVNGRPEGFGSGSPFMMALNGLATKAHASLVRCFRVWGEWNERGLEDFARGRVPDNTMMLNIILRVATDKMTKLESFCWELNCKPIKTLYLGLSTHETLTSFTLRFPSTRVPRPTVLIPPIPNLRVFKALDIDPLSYPDDISMLMLNSKKLEDVRLHFSPRMRAEAEATMNLNMFFGECHKAGYRPQLKHFALQNWFGPNVLGIDKCFDGRTCRSFTVIDTFGGRDPRTVFVDDTWKNLPPDLLTAHERVRCNEVSPTYLEIMRNSKIQMQYFYIISNAKRPKTDHKPHGANINTLASNPGTPSVDTPYDPVADPEWISLGKEYRNTISRYHGPSLKHMLLLDLWAVSTEELTEFVRCCPNLEQLGVAIGSIDHDSIRPLMSLIPKLRILRVLHNEDLATHLQMWTHEERMWHMGTELGKRDLPALEYICLGDFVYKVGKHVEIIKEDGSTEKQRHISMVDKSEVMEYEIWSQDELDIGADPIAPFNH